MVITPAGTGDPDRDGRAAVRSADRVDNGSEVTQAVFGIEAMLLAANFLFRYDERLDSSVTRAPGSG